ncbi:MAG: aldo/keto reductase [Bacillota bacterium]|nr:aldo/keto reductase [Bacillota bacterium]
MLKKKFKCLDIETTLLGMGIMRLPSDDDLQVDEQQGIDLIRYAIDKGINYIDTAYTYHDGMSETIVGKALKDGYRQKVILADKMPIWMAKTEEDLEKLFQTQLERLDLEDGCIDMYLIHNIIPYNWKKTKKLNMIDFLERKKAEGSIKHVGFSFHGSLELFKEVIDAYEWDFCQIQLNYLDKDEQAGLEGLEYARQKGVDVIIMEPLKGGRITYKIPPKVQAIWDQAKASGVMEETRTPAKTAFKWVAAQPGVSLILSGMGSKEQIDENIAIFSDPQLTALSAEEQSAIDAAASEYNQLIRFQCTGCGYCKPCEQRIDIPDIIDYVNNWHAFDKNPGTRMEYLTWIDEGHHASQCIQCGKCEEKCPQGLPIMDIMKNAVSEFGK